MQHQHRQRCRGDRPVHRIVPLRSHGAVMAVHTHRPVHCAAVTALAHTCPHLALSGWEAEAKEAGAGSHV